MYKFIYVFTKIAFDNLISKGYSAVKCDDENSIYVLENKSELSFDLGDEEYVFSNMLTF